MSPKGRDVRFISVLRRAHEREMVICRHRQRFARLTILGDRDYTTSELAKAIYRNPAYDQDFRFRDGKPPPTLKSWQYHRIRLAAPTFCDCVGRSTSKGTPWLWRPRPGEYFFDVRQRKRARDAARRQAKSTKSSGSQE